MEVYLYIMYGYVVRRVYTCILHLYECSSNERSKADN